jgi:hypothetical protein
MALTPCCARIRRYGERWFAFMPGSGAGPVDTLQLVTEAPEFLGMLTPDRPLPRAAMPAPQSQSSRVLLVVDEAGGVQLAVCPEPGVSTSLSSAVGELLAASGRLWHQTYDALAGPFEEFLGMPLADWVGMRVGEGWSQEKFRVGMETNLSEGRFSIVLLVEKLDPIVQETLVYLKNMNLAVRALGYTHTACNGDEVVRPRMLAEARPAPQAPAPSSRQPEPRPGPQAAPPPRPAPEPQQRVYREEFVPSAPVAPSQTGPREYAPLPPSDASPKQREILGRLIRLDELGLVRKGFEYFLSSPSQGDTSEGTIVLAVDADRWPFPKSEEVIVVVRTDAQHLASYLHVAPGEIVEFLSSLPREDRKEHKGSLLLRASNVGEAAQLVNELKALKEVSAGGVG